MPNDPTNTSKTKGQPELDKSQDTSVREQMDLKSKSQEPRAISETEGFDLKLKIRSFDTKLHPLPEVGYWIQDAEKSETLCSGMTNADGYAEEHKLLEGYSDHKGLKVVMSKDNLQEIVVPIIEDRDGLYAGGILKPK